MCEEGEEHLMIIQFDVDGVLANFMLGASTLGHKYDPSIPIVSCEDTTDWDNWEGWSKEIVAKVWEDIKTLPLFWFDLKSLITRDDWMSIRRLMIPENDVYFVTSRPGPTAKWQTEGWLYDRLEKMPTVVVTSNKGGFAKLVGTQWAIEDNPKNAYEIGRVIGPNKSFILDRPYNRNLHEMSATRIYKIDDFFSRLHVRPHH